MRKLTSVFALSLSLAMMSGLNAKAQTTVFSTTKSDCYRIPAITKTQNGNLIAISDKRYGNKGDIGSNRIDLMAKISTNNGSSWGNAMTIAQGSNNSSDGFNYAHGDAAVVSDSESDRTLVIAVAGNVSCNSSTRQNPQLVGRQYATNNGTTWTSPENITTQIYNLFPEHFHSFFFGSGRICQSRQIKTGQYYRLYAALWAKSTQHGMCNVVVYSDDFGGTWKVLGLNTDVPVPGGNEPKCEELPDGNVLVSSRTSGGRYFNIYIYTDKTSAKGSWGTVAKSTSTYGADCNGEIMIVPAKRKQDGKDVYVALQSVPMSNEKGARINVGIYYKVLASKADFSSPAVFANGWTKYQISTTSSAYSTMTLDKNNNVAFLYEENSKNSGYDIQFKSLSLETITGNQYSYNANIDREAFLAGDNGGTTVTPDNTPAAPEVGKIYMLRVHGGYFTDNSCKTWVKNGDYYLYADGEEMKTMPVEDFDKTTDIADLMANYYWVLCQEPGTNTYYWANCAGNGYMGRGWGISTVTGERVNNVPAVTTDKSKVFAIYAFEETKGDINGYSTGNGTKTVGYGMKFMHTDGKFRFVSMAGNDATSGGKKAGEINWDTNNATYIYGGGKDGRYWSTAFLFEEVSYTVPVTFWRSGDDAFHIDELEDYQKYATLNLPFAVVLDNDVKVYKINGLTPVNNTQVSITDFTSSLPTWNGNKILPGGTPVLMSIPGEKGEKDGSGNELVKETRRFALAPAQYPVATGFMGTLAEKTFTKDEYDYTSNPNIYILGRENERVAFYWLRSDKIGGNKAYYVGAKGGSKMLSFVMDGSTTGVALPIAPEALQTDAPIYDLSGRKVVNPTKGIYIRGGKKFVVR